jgi:sigma-B regulation protein RsbU (phosphoserine phosphatase)
MISDVSADKHFRLPNEAQNVKSLLCVPMRMKGRMVGVLAVFNKTGGEPFTESDQRLLTIIAAQSAHVIENARLYEEEQALVRIEQELQTARDIQRRLLPKASPDIPCYDIAGRSEAARRVGGDYFDFIATEGGPTAICLADVSGKGVTASLLMANTQATVRSQALSGGTLAEQLYRANRLLYSSTEDNKFVTMFYSVLDPTKHELLYSNAGHNPPALYRGDADPVLLEAGGPVLGVLPQFTFEQSALTFEIGDLLVIYTDGISEAMNSALDEYGEDRLHRFVRDHQDAPSAKLIDQIFDDVKLFCGEAPQTDDMSMIVMRRIA